MTSKSDEFQIENSVGIYWLILKRRWMPALTIAFLLIAASIIATFLKRPIYRAEGKILLLKTNRASSLTDLTNKSKEISGLTHSVNPLETEVEIIRAGPLIEKTIAYLDLRKSDGNRLDFEDFLAQLQVKGIPGTDIISVSYQDDNPKQSADIVNVLMDYYINNNIYLSRAEADSAKQFIAGQLPEIEQRVERFETELRDFKEVNQIIDLEEEAKVSVSDLSKLSEQINQFKSALADISTQSKALQNKIGLTSSKAVALTALNQSPAVKSILSEYQQLQDQLILESTIYTSEHPKILQLERQEIALKNQLSKRVAEIIGIGKFVSEKDLQLSDLQQNLSEELIKLEVERLGLEDRISALGNIKLTYQSRAVSLPSLEQKHRELERHLSVAQSTYQQLLIRQQEVELATNQNVGNAQIVASALVPKEPVEPKVFLNLMMGVFGSSLAGFLAALVLDHLDTSIKTAKEAKKLISYPYLGVIPLLEKFSDGKPRLKIPFVSEVIASDVDSFARTEFEMLRTTLEFNSSDAPLRTVLVTSSVSGEGKSFIAANLAAAAAQMGQQVLLIDADMRAPCQHSRWQYSNSHGLTEVLSGRSTFKESLKPSMPNLDVMVVGDVPPNPVALLNSEQLASLIREAEREYDLVVFDTPSLSFAPDALTIGRFVDGIIFVLRPRIVDSQHAEEAKFLLDQSGQKVLGLVINGGISLT